MTQTTEQLPILSDNDLKGFDRRRVRLIREMEDYGWRGRRGTKQHMIMRAPDGVTTTAISKKVISPKDEYNTARPFRRWLRQQEQVQAQMSYPAADATSVLVAFTAMHDRVLAVPSAPVITIAAEPAPEPAPELAPVPVDTVPEPELELAVAVLRNTQQACGLCEKPFATLQALSVHRVRTHSKVACEVCDQPMAPGNLPRHMRKHVENIGTHEQAMRLVLQLREELAQAQTEATGWERIADEIEDRYTAVKGRLDNAVEYLLGG